jgi:type I restriction enzyme, R subunit
MQWRDIWGQSDAYEFDLLIIELQRLRLTGGADFQDGAGEVRNLLARLPMRLSQVQAQAELIKEAKEPAFWAPEKPSHEQLEKLRIGCRSLMRFIAESRAPAPAPRTLEVGDSDVEYRRRKSRIAEIDLAAYRANVLRALEKLFETEPALQRIRRGESVSESDLRALTSLVLTQNPDVDLEVLKEFYVVAEPLEKIIRSIVGMDPEAVQARFQDFVHAHPKITAKQTQFLQLLQNHIARHGTIELERLYEPPFTRIDTEGLDGIFADESLADELIDLLAQFERPPQRRAETTEPGEDT